MAANLRVLIASQGENWAFVPGLARAFGLGVEVGDFADPDLLEGDWRARWAELRPLLEQIPGERALHGPRSDLNVGLRDRGLAAFGRERCRRAMEVACEIGAGTLVFHTGYNPLIRAPGFDRRWTQRSAEFWRGLGEEAGPMGLLLLLENVWEGHPQVVRDLVDAVDLPAVRACFDVGHANVFGRRPAAEWLAVLGERAAQVHLHNNDGRSDSHAPLEEGSVDYSRLLPLLALMPQPPRLVVEVRGGREEVEGSLVFLRRLLGR